MGRVGADTWRLVTNSSGYSPPLRAVMGGAAPSTLRWLAGVAPGRTTSTKAALLLLLARLPRYAAAAVVVAVLARLVEKRCFNGSALRVGIAWMYGVRRHTHDVVKHDTVFVPTRDGERLATTLMLPKARGAQQPPWPVVVVRTPYNRFFAAFFSERFAERGIAVVLQDTRGRFESTGKFQPLEGEDNDGVDTLRWIGQQPWSGGPKKAKIAMWGISYLAYTQYATLAGLEKAALDGADDDLPKLSALVPIFGTSSIFRTCFGDGTYSLEMMFRWLHLTHYIGGEGQSNPRPTTRPGPLTMLYVGMFYRFAQEAAMRRSHMLRSLTDMHEAAFGRRDFLVPMNRDPNSEFWKKRDHSSWVHRAPPAHVMSGWYDIFLRDTLDDFQRMQDLSKIGARGHARGESQSARDARKKVAHLTIGPWHHFESLHMHVFPHLLRESVDWLEAQLCNRPLPPRKAVQLFVMYGSPSEGEWREFDAWPPPAKPARLYLRAGGTLSRRAPATEAGAASQSAPTVVIYDPSSPTPSIAGARFHARDPAVVDHRKLEAREDVLCFTSPVLEQSVEVIGRVKLDLYVRCEGGTSADYVGRLLDVHPDGGSFNVCEGICRITVVGEATPIDDSVGGAQLGGHRVQRVEVDMWATAARFQRGHRIRLHVCCGAHPRWQRNPGCLTGDLDADRELLLGPAERIRLRTTTSYIYHDDAYPSSLLLPIAGASPTSRGSVSSQLNMAERGRDVQSAFASLVTRVGSVTDFGVA